MFSLYTVAQLKEELRKRKAKTTGKKAALIARLEAYDLNFNVSNEENDDNVVQMFTPPDKDYKDINSNATLPPLTKFHIQAFTEIFTKQTRNAFQMYENRHLLTARAVRVGDYTYIKCQCMASMKKMFYVVDLKLRNDCGSIEETHCECAVGSGQEAHCKHVLVALYGIEHMVREKSIILHQVCTQKLMTFKRPKPFHASPIKCEELPVKCKKSKNISYDPVKNEAILEGYTDYVRNLIINYGATSAPIKQTFYPANTYAAEWDHSYYEEKTGEHLTLERLHIENVNHHQVITIEENTREQKKCDLWIELHETHLTAHNFHTICHCTESHKVYLANKLIYPKQFRSKATMHGQINEPIAISKFADMYSVHVRKCGIFLSETHPFLGASPDGLFGDSAVVEVKCPYTARYCDINPITVPYLSLINGELILKKKHPYYYQIQGQLFCTGKKYCILIIFTFSHIQTIHIDRDDDFIKLMVDKLSVFNYNYFRNAILEKHLYKNYHIICK